MGKVSARNTSLFAHGRDVSGRSNNSALSWTAETPEVTCYGSDNRERISDGIRDAELTVDGYYDTAASQVDEKYNSLVNASAFYALFPVMTLGNTTGGSLIGYAFEGVMSEYSIDLSFEDAVKTSLTVGACVPFARVRSLGYQTVVDTASAVLASGSGVDFSASDGGTTWHGWHLVSLTGTTPEISACLQESGNDSTWTTTKVWYAAAAAASPGSVPLAEMVSTTSASRYRRFKYLLAGTSPCATILAFSET